MSQSIIFLFICVIVVLLWAINTLIPRKKIIRNILNIVVMIAVVVTVITVV